MTFLLDGRYAKLGLPLAAPQLQVICEHVCCCACCILRFCYAEPTSTRRCTIPIVARGYHYHFNPTIHQLHRLALKPKRNTAQLWAARCQVGSLPRSACRAFPDMILFLPVRSS